MLAGQAGNMIAVKTYTTLIFGGCGMMFFKHPLNSLSYNQFVNFSSDKLKPVKSILLPLWLIKVVFTTSFTKAHRF